MTHLQRLRELFDALLDVPAERWEAWLDEHQIDTATRSELRRLAADEAQSGPLDQTLGALISALPSESLPVLPQLIGQRIGAFRIVSRLGEGGMASVFLARREGADFEQDVALKLLKRGVLSEVEQGFFRRERQVLARLSHPNIARLIDGGVSEEGLPYLAMEYVSGVSITHWCRSHVLDAEARVALVAKVARAVAAAHAALIVHRDIKPANVLMDAAGEPRLLDFGIAKLLEPDAAECTRPGLTPMTPEYAAPEQFDGGAITTATDVYALGLLLFELLTDTRVDRRRIQSPSTVIASRRSEPGEVTRLRIDRDLDRIVLMALAEDPVMRYPGAAAFADDLERYLSRQPVLAHPPSSWYRTRKFVQRHRGGVALVTLLVLGILTSLALALNQAHVAQQEAKRAATVQQFLIDAIDSARATQPRAERPTVADVVKVAAAQVEADSKLDLDTRAELLLVLGKVALSAADREGAERMLARARSVAEGLGPDHPIQWPLRAWAARLELTQSDVSAALALLDETLQLPPPDDETEALDTQMVRANALFVAGRLDEAAQVGEAVVTRAEQVLQEDPEKTLEYRFTLGELLAIANRYERAIEVLRGALEQHRRLGLKPRLSSLSALSGLAQAEARVGNLDRAQEAAEQALALSREIFDPPHPHIARALSTLGVALNARGDSAGSAQAFDDALKMRRELLGPDDPNLIPAITNVGAIQTLRGNHEAALALFLDGWRICEVSPQNTRSTCGLLSHRLAGTYLKLGQLDQAEREATRSLSLRREVFGAESGEVASSLALLANVARQTGRQEVALSQSEAADTLLSHPNITRNVRAEVGLVRARVLLSAGRADEALQRSEQLLEWWRKDSPDEKQFLLQMLAEQSDALLTLGRQEEARAAAEQALALGLSEGEIGAETLQRLQRARDRL